MTYIVDMIRMQQNRGIALGVHTPPSSRAAFTLLEVLLVIVIMGILSSTAVMSLRGKLYQETVRGGAADFQSALVQISASVRKENTALSAKITTRALDVYSTSDCSGAVLFRAELEDRVRVSSANNTTNRPAAIPASATPWNAESTCLLFAPSLGLNPLTTTGFVRIYHFANSDFQSIVYKSATENRLQLFYSQNGGTTWTAM